MIDFMFGMHEELSLSVCLLKILCKGCFVLKHFSTMFKNVVSRLVLQRLPLTRAVEGFFFSTRSDRERSLMAKTYKKNFE